MSEGLTGVRGAGFHQVQGLVSGTQVMIMVYQDVRHTVPDTEYMIGYII